MAAYVTLYNFTEQGLRNIKDTLKRAEAVIVVCRTTPRLLQPHRLHALFLLPEAGAWASVGLVQAVVACI